MDNQKFIEGLLPLVGGAENVTSAITCYSRLRLTFEDDSKVDLEGLKKLDGVLDVKNNGAQTQITVGAGVKKLLSDLEPYLPNIKKKKAEIPQKRKRGNPITVFGEMMSGIFMQIMIPICGSGLICGIQILLTQVGILETGSTFDTLCNVMYNATFWALPFLVAASAADRFKCNKMMAMVMSAVLMYPTWGELLAAGETSLTLFGFLPIKLVDYSSSVIPALLTTYCLSKLEHFLEKKVPDYLHTVVLPLAELLIMTPVALVILGPIGSTVSSWLTTGYLWLFDRSAVLASAAFGGLYPFIVLSGTHLAFSSSVMLPALAATGRDYCMPLMSIAHCGLAPACLAIFFKTRSAKMKQLAATGALVTGIGLTEPALYGVCLPLKKPLIISCICSAIGGAYYGLNKVTALALGLSPLGSIPIYFTETFVHWVIGAVGTAVLAFVLTWFFGYKRGDELKVGIIEKEGE